MPEKLMCGCCTTFIEVSDQELDDRSDVQCPNPECRKWSEIDASGSPTSSRVSYYLKCREQ